MRNIVISPSGRFYGSEQTLATYLERTTKRHTVYVPRNSSPLFTERITKSCDGRMKCFWSPWHLYLIMVLKLGMDVLNGNPRVMYINEAGHLRYALVLARLFGKVKFVIHVRLVEDVHCRPWPQEVPENVEVLATSNYIQRLLSGRGINCSVLSSPFREKMSPLKNEFFPNILIVVSRLSEAKGLRYYLEMLRSIENRKIPIEVHHFGECDEAAEAALNVVREMKYVNWISRGFVKEKQAIFRDGILLHLNPNEPLGVVLLEALNNSIPFIAFDEGGTGEIGRNLQLHEFLINRKECWTGRIVELIQSRHLVDWTSAIIRGREEMARSYNPDVYVERLDAILSCE